MWKKVNKNYVFLKKVLVEKSFFEASCRFKKINWTLYSLVVVQSLKSYDKIAARFCLNTDIPSFQTHLSLVNTLSCKGEYAQLQISV